MNAKISENNSKLAASVEVNVSQHPISDVFLSIWQFLWQHWSNRLQMSMLTMSISVNIQKNHKQIFIVFSWREIFFEEIRATLTWLWVFSKKCSHVENIDTQPNSHFEIKFGSIILVFMKWRHLIHSKNVSSVFSCYQWMFYTILIMKIWEKLMELLKTGLDE